MEIKRASCLICTSICLVPGSGGDPNCFGNPIILDDRNGDGYPNDITTDLSEYRATDIMGLDTATINITPPRYHSKEFNEVNLKVINDSFWNAENAPTGTLVAAYSLYMQVDRSTGSTTLLSAKPVEVYLPEAQPQDVNGTYARPSVPQTLQNPYST